MDVRDLLFVGAGGFLGANTRYTVSVYLPRVLPAGAGAHYATFFANLTGSFLLALFSVWAGRQVALPAGIRLLIGSGFFGAYTTFSTFANETVGLVGQGGWRAAVTYFVLTNGVCMLGVFAGLWVGSRIA